MMETCGAGGEWEYTPVMATLESAGLHPIMEYTRRRHVKIAKKVACCPIYELCVKAERRTETSRTMKRWDQDVVNEPKE